MRRAFNDNLLSWDANNLGRNRQKSNSEMSLKPKNRNRSISSDKKKRLFLLIPGVTQEVDNFTLEEYGSKGRTR